MSHPRQRNFVKRAAEHLPGFFHNASVLEVGSLNINGSVREFFRGCRYTGIDIGAGRDVDVVCAGQRYDAPDGSCDHVISCEAMEHNPFFKGTFLNMLRICRSGGLVTLTCATTGRHEHGTTRTTPGESPLTVGEGWNYYRNLARRDFRRICDLEREFACHRIWINWLSFDLYFLGLKRSPALAPELLAVWQAAARAIDIDLAETNRSRMGRARAGLARLAGDPAFNFLRRHAPAWQALHKTMY